MSADEAAAELHALASLRRTHQRRGPRRDFAPLTPERVAARATSDTTRFFDAMEAVERGEFMEQIAEKLADVAVGHIRGVVDAFNEVRAHFNERRLEQGETALPLVELNSESMRAMLQLGIEEGLAAALHVVLETALHAIFGEPSRLPPAEDAGSAFGPLPALEEPEAVFTIRWSQSF